MMTTPKIHRAPIAGDADADSGAAGNRQSPRFVALVTTDIL
jgi:hypothetical protein